MKRREPWFEDQLELDPGKLVFIDETGAATNMARLRGRGRPIGPAPNGFHNCGLVPTTSIPGAPNTSSGDSHPSRSRLRDPTSLSCSALSCSAPADAIDASPQPA